MRILHTSDWHLGQHFYGKSRINEHQAFLTWLLEQVNEQNVDAVVVAGDIFDTGTPPSYAREMYFDFVVKMHQAQCQLVVLAGNHDSVAMIGESKQILASLSTHVVSCASEQVHEQVFTLNNKQGDAGAVFCAIPFIRPRDVMSSQAGQSAQDKQQNLQQAIAEHYQTLFEHAQTIAGTRLPIIASGHLTTIGATVTDSVRDIYIGTLEAFPASAFPNAHYIALGHIHRPQKVTKSGHIRYSGSPIPLSFDEAKQDKTVNLVDFVKKDDLWQSEVTPIVVPRFQPLVMVKSRLDSLSEDIATIVESTDLGNSDVIWLDIEIDSGEYLHDLTRRIEQLVDEHPVEVLLVRRSKTSRMAMPSNQKKVTLNELSLDDVFAERLNLELWQTEQELERKSTMTSLFKQAVVDTLEQTDNESKTAEFADTKKEEKQGTSA